MKKYLLFCFLFFLSLIVVSCKNKFNVNAYHNNRQRDSLLVDIITFIYVRAPQSNSQTRFDPQFRKYYVAQLGKFQFEKYFVDQRGTHYFYLIRPARSASGSMRGVGGKFRLDVKGRITSFEEIFNTPAATLPILQERGAELFSHLINRGHIDDYLKHPDYIEWPDQMTYYDTLQHEWRIKPGL